MDQTARSTIVWLLTKRLQESGKTKIVKLLFLLQESVRVPLGYRFRMHHYGPYAFDVEDDLAALELEGKVRVAPDALGYGYHVTALRDPLAAGLGDAEPYLTQVDAIVARFGGDSVSALEILTTVVFLNHLTHDTGDALTQRVSQFKPRYSVEFIRETMQRANAERLLITG